MKYKMTSWDQQLPFTKICLSKNGWFFLETGLQFCFSDCVYFQDKPLDVVLTHTHFDHSGGLHQFDSGGGAVTLHVHRSEAAVVVTSGKDNRKTAAWVTSDEVRPKPRPDWSPRHIKRQNLSSF